MSIFLILGIIIPVVYVVRLNVKNLKMTRRKSLITVLLSIIGINVTSLIGSLVTKQLSSLIYVLIGSFFTGLVWGLLLIGSYILFNCLSNTLKK